MTLTEEQIKIIGDSYFDDLPFQYGDIDQTIFWNNMPHLIQCEALKWGANDTEVRSQVMEHVLKTQLDLTYDEWYEVDGDGVYTHELAEAYFGNSETEWVEMDYSKLKG